MFGAGTDTSSLVLEFAMAELMRNPQFKTKLQAEVRVNTPKGQEMVAKDDIASMIYLRAVVKETLRLHPPAPLLLPHLSMVDCESMATRSLLARESSSTNGLLVEIQSPGRSRSSSCLRVSPKVAALRP